MSFKVSKQYGRGAEIPFAERFKTFHEAKAFVDKLLLEEVVMNVKVTYKIYDFDELHSEYDSTKVERPHADSTDSSSGTGKGISFKPTPLNMSPRPAGTPPKWVVDKDEDEKDKK